MAEHKRPQDMWRRGDGKPAPTGGAPVTHGASFRGKLFLRALLVTGLIGVIAAVFWFLRPAPKPIYLSIVVVECEDRNWPINPWAQQDAEALRKHFPDSTVALPRQERGQILTEWNQLVERSRGDDRGRPIVAHLCANAVLHDGSVYILPINAKVGMPSTWIRLDELLDTLKRAEGERLLLLDLRPVVNARLGCLGDDFHESLNDLLAKRDQAGELPFRVICAAGPGSFNVFSRELRRSLFGWYLDRGLAGAADGWNAARKKDDHVIASDLFASIRDFTATSSSRLGNRTQYPTQYGKGKDFTIRDAPHEGPPPASPPQEADAYPPKLYEGWQERDRWLAADAHRRLPRTFLHLQAVLRRAELQWLGGKDPEKIQSDLAAEIRDLQAVRNNVYPDPTPLRRSLAEAESDWVKHRDDAQEKLRPIREVIRRSPQPKMEDQAEFLKHLTTLREKPPDPEAAAAALLSLVIDINDLSIPQMKMLQQTLQAMPNVPKGIEIAMFQFILGIEPKVLERWEREAGTFPRIMVATQAAEKAVLFDSRCLEWLRDDLEKADTLRRGAIAQLISGSATPRKEARLQLDQCVQDYQKITADGKVLSAALREFDEALLWLASLANFESPDRDTHVRFEKNWHDIVDTCKTLQTRLVPESGRTIERRTLEHAASDLAQWRAELMTAMRKLPAAASAHELERWLAWPFWTAKERADLVARINEVGLPQIKQALEAVPERPGVADPRVPNPEPSRRTIARARRAIDVLTLTGDPEAAKLEAQLQSLQQQPDSRGVQELARIIERRWREQLPERYQQAADLRKKERLGWAIHPFDLPAVPQVEDAAAKQRELDRQAFAAWLSKRDAADRQAIDNALKMIAAGNSGTRNPETTNATP